MCARASFCIMSLKHNVAPMYKVCTLHTNVQGSVTVFQSCTPELLGQAPAMSRYIRASGADAQGHMHVARDPCFRPPGTGWPEQVSKRAIGQHKTALLAALT